MRRIVMSCFGKKDSAYKEYIEQLLLEDATYKAKYKIKILTDKEIEFIEFLIKSFENAGEMPSQTLFEGQFPETVGVFDNVPELDIEDFRVYIHNYISKKANKQISKEILAVTKEIETEGVTDELKSRLDELHRISNLHKEKKVDINYDFKAAYQEKLNRPIGWIFNIKALDDKIGGLSEGSLTTIAGFTSHFKSTCGMNLAMFNSYYCGYNIIYVTLETPKEDMYMNLLSRHSYNTRFPKYNYISHDKQRKCNLTQDEMDYLFDVVDKDWKDNSKGKLILLDESDFDTLSFTEFYSVFENVDRQLLETTGAGLHGFIIDYIQLLKFIDGKFSDDNRAINAYVSFFRKMTQNFVANNNRKKLTGVILSQINRESWKSACKKGGKYDLTCLADANEQERGSHRVITTFTTEEMKMRNEAQVQILKNRGGATMWEPSLVYANGEAYIFQDDDESFGSGPVDNLGGGLSSLLDNDDTLGGLI